MTNEEMSKLIDGYNTQRNLRLLEQKQVDAMEVVERDLKKRIIEVFTNTGLTAAGGETAVIRMVTKPEPFLRPDGGIDQLYAHVRETGEFDLLYRRINPAAIKLRKDVGVDVPGIEWFPVTTLSISQITKPK